MELTRRDAVAALTAIGVGSGALSGCAVPSDPDPGADVDAERIREVLVAAADVVYPDVVSGTEAFVEAFLEGRLEGRAHAIGVDEAVAELDEHAESWYGERFPALSAETRDQVLHGIGAAMADEDPDGTTAERVRYYVVNELLLALYASPTGGELVGLENPQGHAGGIDTYQRGPRS